MPQLDEFYLDLQKDGNNVGLRKSSLYKSQNSDEYRNPFPGLRPFRTSEFLFFCGRERQITELIARLAEKNFLAVIGTSGTGKSSLVRAGLIPQLFGGNLYANGNAWQIAMCRPGHDPIENLAISLAKSVRPDLDGSHFTEAVESAKKHLDNSPFGILEFKDEASEALESKPAKQKNLLIVIDQFEELFRFNREGNGREEHDKKVQFVDLLLEASTGYDKSVFVVITMRSEFLGASIKFAGLAEAINRGQYLVPQLDRHQLHDVIEEPLKLVKQEIDANLVTFLINECEYSKYDQNLDQLPILQHTLMCAYNRAVEKGSSIITTEHFEEIGGVKGSLSMYANQLFEELPSDRAREIAKLIFQVITDLSTDINGGRRPSELQKIVDIIRAHVLKPTSEEVVEILHHFRKTESSFIMPPANITLYSWTVIDIAHESLMRNWDLLKGWIKEEVQEGKNYKTLNEIRKVSKGSDYIGGYFLEEMTRWKNSYRNSLAWASRYQDSPKEEKEDEQIYIENVSFLERSIEQEKKEHEEQKRLLQLEIKLEEEKKVMWLKVEAAQKEKEIEKLKTEAIEKETNRLSILLDKTKKERELERVKAEKQAEIVSHKNEIARRRQYLLGAIAVAFFFATVALYFYLNRQISLASSTWTSWLDESEINSLKTSILKNNQFRSYKLLAESKAQMSRNPDLALRLAFISEKLGNDDAKNWITEVINGKFEYIRKAAFAAPDSILDFEYDSSRTGSFSLLSKNFRYSFNAPNGNITHTLYRDSLFGGNCANCKYYGPDGNYMLIFDRDSNQIIRLSKKSSSLKHGTARMKVPEGINPDEIINMEITPDGDSLVLVEKSRAVSITIYLFTFGGEAKPLKKEVKLRDAIFAYFFDRGENLVVVGSTDIFVMNLANPKNKFRTLHHNNFINSASRNEVSRKHVISSAGTLYVIDYDSIFQIDSLLRTPLKYSLNQQGSLDIVQDPTEESQRKNLNRLLNAAISSNGTFIGYLVEKTGLESDVSLNFMDITNVNKKQPRILWPTYAPHRIKSDPYSTNGKFLTAGTMKNLSGDIQNDLWYVYEFDAGNLHQMEFERLGSSSLLADLTLHHRIQYGMVKCDTAKVPENIRGCATFYADLLNQDESPVFSHRPYIRSNPKADMVTQDSLRNAAFRYYKKYYLSDGSIIDDDIKTFVNFGISLHQRKINKNEDMLMVLEKVTTELKGTPNTNAVREAISSLINSQVLEKAEIEKVVSFERKLQFQAVGFR